MTLSASSEMSLSGWRWSEALEETPLEEGMEVTESELSTFLRSFSST
jgi:hypothetical protein